MLLSFSPFLCARLAWRNPGLAFLVAGFLLFASTPMNAQGSCNQSGNTITCSSSDLIVSPLDHSTPLPHSSPTKPTTNYPFAGTVSGVQVSLSQVTSNTGSGNLSLFYAQAVLVSPDNNHAIVF